MRHIELSQAKFSDAMSPSASPSANLFLQDKFLLQEKYKSQEIAIFYVIYALG